MLIHDITASPGDVITVELEIINEDEFAGFNLDIPLPDGFTYVEGTAQLYRDDGHFFNFAIVAGNVARMLSAAIPTTPFLGNDGVIVSFDLQTPAIQGTYVLDIVDAVIVDAAGVNIMTGHVPGTVTLSDDDPPQEYVLNINVAGSGSVFVNGDIYTDPLSVAQGTSLTLEAVADAGWSFDGWSGDLSGTQSPIDIVMDSNKNVTAAFSLVIPDGNIMLIHDITSSPGDVITVELEIINEDDFAGFNLDIPLPDGFTYVDGTAQLYRDDGHFFNFAIVAGNVARMLSAAIPTTPFLGNDGVIVSFDLQTPAIQGTYVLDIVDAVIVDAAGVNIMTGHFPGMITLEDMPDNLYLYDLYITDGMLECFSALISIITAGGNTEFIIYDGGSVELIAGQSIHLLPGTTVEQGGYLLARIAAHEDDYCGIPRAIEIAKEPVTSKEEDVVSADFPYEIRENGFFKLYPNPTTGDFTLELLVFEETSTLFIEIFTVHGHLLTRNKLPTQRLYNLSLTGRQPGIYFIRVLKDNETGTSKIIKQ